MTSPTEKSSAETVPTPDATGTIAEQSSVNLQAIADDDRSKAAKTKLQLDRDKDAQLRKRAYEWKRRIAFLPVIVLSALIVAAAYIWSVPLLIFSINLPAVGIIIATSSATVAALKIYYNAPSLIDLEAGKPGVSWAKHNVEVGAFTVSFLALVFFLSAQVVNLSKQSDQEVRELFEKNDIDWLETRFDRKLCELAQSVGSDKSIELCDIKTHNAKPQFR